MAKCHDCAQPAIPYQALCEAHRRVNAGRRFVSAAARARALLAGIRSRAKLCGVQCSITADIIENAIEAGYCALTGLPFDLSRDPRFRANPYAPSVDRIVAGGDYSPENCRIIIYAANAALNEWGEAVYRHVASAYLERNPLAH